MRKFRGSLGEAAPIAIVFAAVCYTPFWMTNNTPSRLREDVGFTLVWLCVALYTGWRLLEWCAVYELDEVGIKRRGWYGSRYMRWTDVIRFNVSGDAAASLVLLDNQRRKLRVMFTFLGDTDLLGGADSRGELHKLIDHHLYALRKKLIDEIGAPQTIYWPDRWMILPGLTMMMIAAFVIAVASKSGSPSNMSPLIPEGFALIIFMVSLSYLIPGLSRRLTITADSVTERSWGSSKTIAFRDMKSCETTKQVVLKGDSYEIAHIGDGGPVDIQIASKMIDYSLLLEFFRNHLHHTAATPPHPGRPHL